MNRFKTRLLWQIVPVFFLIMIPAFAIVAGHAYKTVLDIYVEESAEGVRGAVDYMKSEIQDNPNYEWLLAYWSEHADELSIVYDDTKALLDVRSKFLQKNPGVSIDAVTLSQLEEMSEESRALYASLFYMKYTLGFDRIKNEYNLRFLYLTKLTSSDNQTFIIAGALPDETRGTGDDDIYVLGVEKNPNLNDHCVLKKIWDDKTECFELEPRYDSSGRKMLRYYIYTVLDSSDDGVYVIGTCLDATAMNNALFSKIDDLALRLLFIILTGVIIVNICFYFILLKPIGILQREIRKFTANKECDELERQLVAIKNQNEVGQLSRDVTKLSKELIRYTNEAMELSASRERIETELSVATRIQAAALPELTSVFKDGGRFEIDAVMRPAKEVGGDFYDFFMLDDDHVAIAIADVSGKGIPAAMFMLVSIVMIRNVATTQTSPAKILELVNEQLCARNEAEMFVTCWLGILEISTGELTTANAGHEFPIVCKADGSVSVIKDKHGFVMGGMSNVKYVDQKWQLNKGDTIFVYTDGVTEATNCDNELYGMDRVVEVLEEAGSVRPGGIIDAVIKSTDLFVKDSPQFDDMTMLGLKYYG